MIYFLLSSSIILSFLKTAIEYFLVSSIIWIDNYILYVDPYPLWTTFVGPYIYTANGEDILPQMD
jgi:hypothetical protein